MLLRTRITLIVSLAFVVLAVGLTLASLRREHLADDRYADATLTGQETLWRKIVENMIQRMEARGASVVVDDGLVDALDRDDEPALRARLQAVLPALAGGVIDRVDIADRAGQLRYSSVAGLQPIPVMDAGLIGLLLSDGRTIRGVQQAPSREFTMAVAVPIKAGDRVVGAATFASDVMPALRELAGSIGAHGYLVNLRGRLVHGTDEALWKQLSPQPSVRQRSLETLSMDRSGYFAMAAVPIPDSSGRTTASLVTLKDVTASFRRQRDIHWASIAGTVLFLAAILSGLSWYLRRSFAPLNAGIAVLNALSRGDTSVSIDNEGGGNDEIGRIASTVGVFRDHAVTLDRLRDQQDRQRRRQERFIRQQMEALAETLPEEARGAVLQDLKAIVGGPQAGAQPADQTAGKAEQQLGLLAVVLKQLSTRVADQHRRLDGLVVELQDALKHKTQLIGLQQELEIARQMQLSIVPREFPKRDDVEVVGLLEPAQEVGGDFYDFFSIDAQHIGVVVADISCKGAPAAFFMAISRTLLKATTPFSSGPSDCLKQINELICAENEQAMFVTMFYGVLDTVTGILTYANAGHYPPLVVSRMSHVRRVEPTGGLALGLLPGQSYRDRSTQLEPGDTLVAYSDGVLNAINAQGESFGEDRFAELLGKGAGAMPARELPRLVLHAAKQFNGDTAQEDDLTCVALRYHGAQAVAEAAE